MNSYLIKYLVIDHCHCFACFLGNRLQARKASQFKGGAVGRASEDECKDAGLAPLPPPSYEYEFKYDFM